MYEGLSDAQKEVVKAVLFGKQKQASVINDGVVAVVGRGIEEVTSGSALQSETDFVEAVRSFLQSCIDEGRAINSILLMLLGGEKSLVTLQADGPKVVRCESAGPDTPKFYFGILPLGEEPERPVGDFSGMMNAPISDGISRPTEPGFIPDDLSYSAQRDYLVKTIVPLVPEAVKKELSSPVEQALVGAQWYFKNN